MVLGDIQDEQEKQMDIIGLLLYHRDDDTNLDNIKEFKKINDYYYNFSCEEKKYFCAPVLFGSFKKTKQMCIL